MSKTPGSRFVYVTYIRTTPDKLWHALTTREFMAQYWLGASIATDWKVGSAWTLAYPDGRVMDDGEVLEFEPPKRLALRWVHRADAEATAEGPAVCMMELEPMGEAVRLTVTHAMERENSKLIAKVSGGWPRILSNLKSLLETGTVLLPAK
jgi:uncharacterized protein YndB with AHSA1/START domain